MLFSLLAAALLAPPMQAAPLVAGKVDNEQPARRQLLAQALARIDVARGDQHQRRFVEAGIVADQ